ncbi:MAG: LamG-like jellyroll fold domain-containing protein [Planctomycetota bacterium]
MPTSRRLVAFAPALLGVISSPALGVQVVQYSFDETDGGVPTPIVDSIGPPFSSGGQSGALNLNVAGVLGSGASFDGVNDVAGTGGASSEFKIAGDFTYTMWVNLPSLAPNVQDRLIDATNSNSGIGAAQGWRLLLNPGGAGNAFKLQLQANGNNQAGNVNASFTGLRDVQSDGSWTFIALRYDADGQATVSVLYDSDTGVDAALVATNSASVGSDGSLTYGGLAAPRIGANQNGSGAYLTGLVDEIGLWDEVLSDEELAGVFTAVIPEPASASLLALGAVLAVRRRRA